MNYTVVLYKSDGCNTCRGCIMEQWGSDFSLDTNVAEVDAIKQIAAAFTRPSEGGSYTAYLIGVCNGQQVVHTFEQYHDWRHDAQGGWSTDTQADEDWEVDNDEGKRLNSLIREQVAQILEQQRLASEQAAAEEKKKQT